MRVWTRTVGGTVSRIDTNSIPRDAFSPIPLNFCFEIILPFKNVVIGFLRLVGFQGAALYAILGVPRRIPCVIIMELFLNRDEESNTFNSCL